MLRGHDPLRSITSYHTVSSYQTLSNAMIQKFLIVRYVKELLFQIRLMKNT